jgi:DNA-binding transcriptional LysR family regulator
MWQERSRGIPLELIQVGAADAVGLIRSHEVDAALLRLPIDRTGLHAIPLYVETTVVVVPKDHVVTVAEEVTTEDLADELMLHPRDDVLDWAAPPGQVIDHRPATTAEAIELVAAGTGLLVVPQSLARLYHRRDLTYRPLADAPQSGVALSWPEDETTELMEQFIGIVRGRTVNSSRGAEAAATRKATPVPTRRPAKSPDRRGGQRRRPRR